MKTLEFNLKYFTSYLLKFSSHCFQKVLFCDLNYCSVIILRHANGFNEKISITFFCRRLNYFLDLEIHPEMMLQKDIRQKKSLCSFALKFCRSISLHHEFHRFLTILNRIRKPNFAHRKSSQFEEISDEKSLHTKTKLIFQCHSHAICGWLSTSKNSLLEGL